MLLSCSIDQSGCRRKTPILPALAAVTEQRRRSSNQPAVAGKVQLDVLKSNKSNVEISTTTTSSHYSTSLPNFYLTLSVVAAFKFQLELAVRAGVGTVLAGLLMTKAHATNSTSTLEGQTHWVFFPDWYIFGGLSVVAMATVFGAGNNIGATVREIAQQLGGVGSALLYNMVVFYMFPPQSFASVHECMYVWDIVGIEL
ncbi:hypothetical protein DYB37_011867 [Aphanomyces astaci]|uniref:Uncharacterized protein n=1 Tax=Aphanomyces astaci TaxID=112090 RepID=A0A418E142_APHAT|nr:hypothetical protein DYB37_011867 [Aphanomyces astaci]